MLGNNELFQVINPKKKLFEKILSKSIEKLKNKNIKIENNNKNHLNNNNNNNNEVNFDGK